MASIYDRTFYVNTDEDFTVNLYDVYPKYNWMPPSGITTPSDEYGVVFKLKSNYNFINASQVTVLTTIPDTPTTSPRNPIADGCMPFITAGDGSGYIPIIVSFKIKLTTNDALMYEAFKPNRNPSLNFYVAEKRYNGQYQCINTNVATIYFVPVKKEVTPEQPSGFNPLSRVVNIEKNKTTIIDMAEQYPNGEAVKFINNDLPAFATKTDLNGYTQSISCSPTQLSSNESAISVYKNGLLQGNAYFKINVVESIYEEVDNCCSNQNINITWINREGGRGNFIFTQRKDFSVEVGKKSTFITGEIKKYSQIKQVYNQVTVYAKGISLNALNYLDGLRYSIQAWVFSNGFFSPILLDVKSFEKYNTKENMYDVQITFTYANDLNIQTQ